MEFLPKIWLPPDRTFRHNRGSNKASLRNIRGDFSVQRPSDARMDPTMVGGLGEEQDYIQHPHAVSLLIPKGR